MRQTFVKPAQSLFWIAMRTIIMYLKATKAVNALLYFLRVTLGMPKMKVEKKKKSYQIG